MRSSHATGRAFARLAGVGGLLLAMLAAVVGAATPARAATAELFFSEYVEGSSFNKALEIYNGTGAAVDLSAYSVELYSNGSASASQSVTLSGSLADGDVFVMAHGSAVLGITPDLLNSTVVNFNGDDAVVLRKNGAAIDVIGQIGFDPGSRWGTSPASTENNTLRRKAEVCAGDADGANAFAPSVEWDGFASDTFGGLGSHTASCDTPPQPTVINEVLASTTGTDVEYIELYGEPGASLAGLSLIYVESNNASGPGTIDFRYDFAASATIGLNGFYLIGTPAGLQSFYGVTPNATIADNSLENSSATVALVQTSSLSGSSVGGSEIVLDTVGITDATASTFFFGAPVIGPDGSFFPPGVRRVADGVDTDTAADWVQSDFNLGSANTPTAGTTADVAPTVSATSPAAGAANVPVSSNISVTFSESVDVAAGAISVECPSGAQVASNAAASDVTSVTIDPASDLPALTACVIAISAAGVTDNDLAPDPLAGTTSFGFTTGTASGVTPISAIQGTGSAVASGSFIVEAIVVGDYQTQGSGQLRGFFLQEEDADSDGNAASSEGIFVFCSGCPTAVSVGDKVRVSGTASDFNGMSQLTATSAASVSVLSSGNPLPSPAELALPVPGVPNGNLAAATAAINAYFEAAEGMLVRFPAELSVAEYFELARYGQVILSADGRPYQFTHDNAPTAAGFIDHQIDLARRTVILDDTDNIQNRPIATNPNTNYYYPVPGLSTSNFFRGGDTITGLTGVLHWSFAGQSGTDAWRIRPVVEEFSYAFTAANPRPGDPEVDGRLKVASFNVLNYFLTIDTTASDDVGTCGPSGTLDCRGADSAQELALQRAKMLEALAGLDADVIGLMEMENTPGVEPLADIVAGLPGYGYIDTGVIGTDAIRVGIIYRTGTVQPLGDYAILDSSVDPRFVDTRNRPALAQSFEETATGARFTVVVNHLKSKGSGCGAGDDDTTTGQGNCNGTRTRAAQALADWLAGDPTGSGDTDVLIIGDLNSNAMEDPITALKNAGYTDLVAAFGGPEAYGYVFDGQLGYLDHALANPALTPQVVDVVDWHINADEIPLFDYNDDVRDVGEADAFEEESDTQDLYEPNEFRTSDHDPVIVGLDLDAPPVLTVGPGACLADFRGQLTLQLSDDNTAADQLTLSASSSNPALTFTLTPSGASRTLVVSTVPGQNGSGTITLTLDDGGLTTITTITVVAGTSNNDTLNGTDGPDVLFGGNAQDILYGVGGNDLLCGGQGDDQLVGDAGDDSLDGGSGQDKLDGGQGNDQLSGGQGDDQLSGGDGSDTLLGGQGQDRLTGGAAADHFDGGAGNDTATDLNAADGDTSVSVP